MPRAGVSEAAKTHHQADWKLSVNFAGYTATTNGKDVKMSHKEFEILHYLYNHKNETVDRDKLLDSVWGDDYQPTSRTIDNFIVRLRQRLKDLMIQVILTVHGIGYKLIEHL